MMERAGKFTGDEADLRKAEDQRIWILILSGVLCVTGITNTMLMSVTERSGEIGTTRNPRDQESSCQRPLPNSGCPSPSFAP